MVDKDLEGNTEGGRQGKWYHGPDKISFIFSPSSYGLMFLCIRALLPSCYRSFDDHDLNGRTEHIKLSLYLFSLSLSSVSVLWALRQKL